MSNQQGLYWSQEETGCNFTALDLMNRNWDMKLDEKKTNGISVSIRNIPERKITQINREKRKACPAMKKDLPMLSNFFCMW